MQGKQMQHFTSFYADFGIVKQANKLLKRNSYISKNLSLGGLSKAAANKEPMFSPQEKINRKLKEERRDLREEGKENQYVSPVVQGKPNSAYNLGDTYTSQGTLNPKRLLADKINKKQVLNQITSSAPNKILANRKAVEPTLDVYDLSDSLINQQSAKEVAKRQLNYVRGVRKKIDEPTKFLPIHQSKNERLDFSPTRQQLNEVYTKHYEKDNGGANKYDPKLITGSANHTWLTADGQYMEIPIGQSEMPLNSNMWKGRISGKRLPPQEVKGLGEIGSPVRGISGSQLRGEKPMYDMSHKLVQTSENYNNQIANKRYIPKD